MSGRDIGVGSSVLMALSLSGCASGSTLDTPYQEYALPPDGVVISTTDATSSTGAPTTCDDQQVDEVFSYWCGQAPCHGSPDTNDATQPKEAPFWIFSPTRAADWIGRRGTLTAKHDCTAEVIIDATNPGQSLLVSSVRHTSACGQEMPDQYPLIDDSGVPLNDEYAEVIACIESWVNGVVATQAGVTAQPGVGGTSAF